MVGLERDRQGDRGGVRAAPAQGGDVELLGLPLEAGDHDHPAPLQLGDDPLRDDVEDPRLAVRRAGPDPRLRPGQGHRLAAVGGERHGQQRGGDHLPGAEQLVHLPRRRVVGELVGEGDQLVGGVAHGADHHHHPVAELPAAPHPVGDAADPLR